MWFHKSRATPSVPSSPPSPPPHFPSYTRKHTDTRCSFLSRPIAFIGVWRLLGDIRTQRLGFMGHIMGLLVHDSTWRSGPGCHLSPPGARQVGVSHGGEALNASSTPRSTLISTGGETRNSAFPSAVAILQSPCSCAPLPPHPLTA